MKEGEETDMKVQRERRTKKEQHRKPAKSQKQEHKEGGGNDVYESVNDVIWADICSPQASLIGHSV